MNKIRKLGYQYLNMIEDLGLLLIAVLTVIAMGTEVVTIYQQKAVMLGDLLLLFIYLEVLAMVGLYLKSGRLPVRMPLYIVIVALARYMALDMKNLDAINMISISAAILIVATSILVIRFGHKKFPYGDSDADQ
ncbi:MULTISPECIES: phosphate-starvation-inducible protein PsiE [Vibrio]|uniref:Protein PsiE n=2 Tax=Vibrio TaxID=662 RepID=A0A7X4RX46_9VIBR|nr:MULTISPECIES: phosphate-starvation-inducible PsiE family protein [Vibrio]MBF9002537.1 phosphate-starvation-inducible PsiE family protein [Vibrio nitrifigilis]MZI96130.1 phosphate-starvation-inducible E [Vibrio eleionomae]